MKRTKTNPYDWALIRWARACEEADVVDNERVEPIFDAEKDERGRLIDPLAYLSYRANKVLDSIGLSGKRWIERSVAIWFGSTLFVIALGAIVFPFARVDHILGGNVNLAGPFLFFVLGQIFFLTVSLILVCAVCIQTLRRNLRHDDRPETFTERCLEGFSGIVGTVVIFALQKCAPTFYKIFSGKGIDQVSWKNCSTSTRNGQKDPEQEKNEKEAEFARRREALKKGASLFWDTLFSRPRFLFFWGGFLSHLFWTSCSLCVLLVLCGRMQGNRYDYCWHTSLEDEAAVKQGVDILGAPIAWFGGTVPDENDVSTLFQDKEAPTARKKKTEHVSDEVYAEEQKTAAKIRARWSYFLLGVVFVWCVLPRMLLVSIYYLLFRRALRDYRPILEEEYYQKLIVDAEAYKTSTSSTFVDDPIDANIIPETPEERQDGEERRVEAVVEVFEQVEKAAPRDASIVQEVEIEKIGSPKPPTIESETPERPSEEPEEIVETLDNAEEIKPVETVETSAPTEEVNAVETIDVPEIAKEIKAVETVDVPEVAEDTKVVETVDVPEIAEETKPVETIDVPEVAEEIKAVQTVDVPEVAEEIKTVEPIENIERVEQILAEQTRVETPENQVVEKTLERAAEQISEIVVPEPQNVVETTVKEVAPVIASVQKTKEVLNVSRTSKPKDSLAFGYDAEISQERWNSILPPSPKPIVFGDVAGDFVLRKKLKSFLDERGELISRCVYITDVGLSPARHYMKFMRDILIPSVPNATIYVVLSGGEKLRVKYGENSPAVSERLEDWTNALNALSRASGLTIVPVFFYDAELDLPEQRARLRELILANDGVVDLHWAKKRNYAKWDASNRLVLSECRAIFSAAEFTTDEEEDRRRVARVCADIFELYREETTAVANAGALELRKVFGYSSLLDKVQNAADNARSVLAGSVARESMAVKDALVERCKEQGLTVDMLEQKLTSAWGLSEKMRGFCSKLSPKCAIATASVGLSIPALVAFAPLLGGAATATAVASTFGALGTLLPTSVASGVAAGALGAVAPMSLNACKKKLVSFAGGIWDGIRPGSQSVPEVTETVESGDIDPLRGAKIETVAALVCVTTTWRVVLELQGLPENEIAARTPEALAPIENSMLDSLERVEKALNETRALLPKE